MTHTPYPIAAVEDLIPATRRVPRRVVGISVVAAIGGFLFGFDTAIINGAVDPITNTFGLSTFSIGVVVAITLIGAAFGASSAGWLADRIGRRPVMFLAALLFIVAAVGCGLAFSFTSLAIWRLIAGFGVGIASVIAPLYISEIAPARVRGRLASLQQMAIVLGIFAALLSSAVLAQYLNGADADLWFGLPAWRWMFLTGVVPALIYGILAMSIPESPRYLVSRRRVEAAETMLVSLHRVSVEEARGSVRRMSETLKLQHRPRFRDLLDRKTGLLRIVWVGLGLAALQALVGIDVIFYYSTSLWHSVGFGESASFALSVVSSIVNVVVTVVAIFLIDRVGRRPLLLVGSAGMAFSLILVSIGFSQAAMRAGELELPAPWGVITLVAANVFIVFFAVSWGPVVWVLLSEMFPNAIRGVALSAAAGVNWAAGVLVNLTFPTLREISLSMSYGLYAVFAVVSWLLVYYFVRETANKELEDM